LHPGVFKEDSYTVQSAVSEPHFKAFLDYLAKNITLKLTPQNLSDLSQLAQEFGLPELERECAAASASSAGGSGGSISAVELQRLDDLESRVRELSNEFLDHQITVESLALEISRVSKFQTEITEFRSIVEVSQELCKRTSAETTEDVHRLKREVETTTEKLRHDIESLRHYTEKGQSELNAALTTGIATMNENVADIKARQDRAIAERVDRRFQELHKLLTIATTSVTGLANRPYHLPAFVTAPSDGLIRSLARRFGGNVQDLGIVEIRASSSPDSAKNVVDLKSTLPWISNGEPNGWIQFGFGHRRIRIEQYTLSSGGQGPMKSWTLEGSADGVNWTELHSKEGDSRFKKAQVATFPISKQMECQSLKLKQTGKNHQSNDVMELSVFDVFGTMIESP
jgi:hypothetical protein